MSTNRIAVVEKLSRNFDTRKYLDEGGFRVLVRTPNDKKYSQVDVTDAVLSVDWSDSLDQAAMQGSMTLWDPVDSVNPTRDLNMITKGCRIIFSVIDIETGKLKEIGRFVIWEKVKRSSISPEIEITFYDPLIYLMKSEDSFLFTKDKAHKKGWTASEITRYICRRYQIPIGRIPKAKHPIPYFRVDGGSVYDVILKAWTEERSKTNVRYIIRSIADKLVVFPKRDQKYFWGVVEGENLIDISFTDSLENMYTALTIVSESGSNSSDTQTTTAGTQGATDPPGSFVSGSGGGEWSTGVASFFTVSGESSLACSGYTLSDSLMGWGEASTNYSATSGWDFSALGNKPCGTILEVKYKDKVLRLPKVDKGRGGPGIGNVPRVMDLTRAAWDKFGIPRNKGIQEVQYRFLDGKDTTTDTSSTAVNKSTAKTPAVRATLKKNNKIKTYGYIHKLLPVGQGITRKSALTIGINALNEASRENYDARLTTYFMPFVRAGDPLYVRSSGSGLVGRFYVSDVSHTLSSNACVTELGLNWLDVVPSLDIDDSERQPQRTSSGGSGGVGGGGTIDGCGPVPNGSWGGGPGIGTHSFSSPPDNWESDNAYDIFAPDGTPVVAVGPGRIGNISPFSSDGRFWGHGLHLTLNDGTETYYKHMKTVTVRSGQTVQAGEILGYLGTGVNGGPHLHFGVKPPNKPDRFKNVCGPQSGGTGGSGDVAPSNGLLAARWNPMLTVGSLFNGQFKVNHFAYPKGTRIKVVYNARACICEVNGRATQSARLEFGNDVAAALGINTLGMIQVGVSKVSKTVPLGKFAS